MAVFQFSAVSDGRSISFNPNADVLNFDQSSIAAADIRVTASGSTGSNVQVTHVTSGKFVTLLNVNQFQLATTNVTFADGSRLLFGDNSTAQNDNAANSLTGTAGRDLLAGFGGADTMNGGLGDDTYIVGTGDVLIDAGGMDKVEADINWTLADGFENLTATGSAGVSLTGNNAANLLVGNSGANFFNPRGGNDTIAGGNGNDFVRLGGGGVANYGNKVMDGGAGFDGVDFGGLARSAIVVDLAAGSLTGGGEGGTGSASLINFEQVIGDGFNDRLSGAAAAESLNGGGGNDTIEGRGGNDTVTGGLGQDTFVFATAPGAGNVDQVTDFVSATDKLSFDNAVFTGLGAPGNFTAGDARFASGPGLTSGQDPSDRLIYNTTTRELFYDADGNGAGAAQRIAALPGTAALNATDIVVTGQTQPNPGQGTPGNDSLVGTEGNDSLAGLAGNDTLRGLGGNDTLDGGPGIDSLDGGLGNDTYIVRRGEADAFTDPGNSDVFVDAGGVDTVIAIGLPWRLDPGIENLILRGTGPGGAGGIGNDLNNVITNEGQTGLGEDPFLDGAGGNDTLIGSGVNETFSFSGPSGNFGNDSVDGGGGIDTLNAGGSGPVTVDFRTGTMTGTGGSVVFTNIERANGTSLNDSLTANDSGVRLFGFQGNDTLTGGGGNDLLVADGEADFAFPTSAGGSDVVTGGGGNDDIWLGVGNDQADAGSGNDRFVFQGQFNYGNDTIGGGDGVDEIFIDAFGRVDIDLGAGTMRGGSSDGGGTASLTGIENFSVVGGPSNIIGSSGANNLSGADGTDDTINGAGGADTLSGGSSGADHFVFDQAPGAANADLVTDFESAADTLELHATVMPALGPSGRFAEGDARFHAAAGATAGHDADDRVVYDTSTGNVFYDADGNGGGGAQLIATLQGRPTLAASDILVVGGGGAPGANIRGTEGDDTLDGTDGNDTIDGLGGNDLLSGRFGSDLVRGGAGNDRLKDREDSDAAAPDTLDGGLGDDIFDLLANPLRPHTVVLVDAGGVDTVWSNHDFVLPAGIENLTLFEGRSGVGNELGNVIVASGNLSFYEIDGAGGNDTLIGAPDSRENMTGGTGSDVFRLLRPSSEHIDQILDFASGTDTLQLDKTGFANLGAPGRFSAADERFFIGGSAHDASDRVIYNTETGFLLYDADGTGPSQAVMIAVMADLVASDITVIGEAAPGAIEGTAGNDSLTGTEGNDSISGLAGSDTINALGGNDTLDGGAGIDTMNGGLGDDIYIVTAGDVLSDPGGVDKVEADINWSLADGFENLTATGTAGVSLTGNNAANLLVGNSGNNFFNPRGGNDTISGGAGNDFVRLGGGGVANYGSKVMDGGAGFDGMDFGGLARSGIVVDLAAGTLSGGGEGGTGSASLIGFEQVIGDGFNDRLSGSAAAESLAGGGGNDTLEGGGGIDTVDGGVGNDTLSGGDGNDFLVGGDGNDRLEGGIGSDVLTGGAGQDSFVFLRTLPAAGGVDGINDFASATDRLLFDNAAFTALGADGNFVAGDARFAAGADFSSGRDPSDRLIYDTTTGRLWYDPDGNGSGSSQQIAVLLGHPALTATDITVI